MYSRITYYYSTTIIKYQYVYDLGHFVYEIIIVYPSDYYAVSPRKS